MSGAVPLRPLFAVIEWTEEHFVYFAYARIGTHSELTLRRLMSYIYVEHPFLMFLDHTQRRSTVGRTPLDE